MHRVRVRISLSLKYKEMKKELSCCQSLFVSVSWLDQSVKERKKVGKEGEKAALISSITNQIKKK